MSENQAAETAASEAMAIGTEAQTATAAETSAAQAEVVKPQAETFTSADVEKLVTAKLEEFQRKQTEAEKLSKMTSDERAEHEKKEREEDYNKRLTELTKKELRIEAHKTLTERKLPIELLDTLHYGDAESCNASIAAVEKAFRAAVEAGVNDRLRGKPPASSVGSSAALTMEQISRMSQAEVMANMGEIEKALAQSN